MGPPITLLAAFAAIFVVQAAHGLHFPREKTLVYKYYGDVKAGTIDPAPYASEFTLEGTLHVSDYNTPDVSLSPLRNVFHVALSDIKTGMHNGAAGPDHRIETLSPIDETVAAVLHRPFLIIYDTNGLLVGVKIPANEPGWSKNMKMAMASMLQLDLASINFDSTVKRQNFITYESTIHGNCSVTYDVFHKNQPEANEFVIMKFSSPRKCTGFAFQSFNHIEVNSCQPIKEEPLAIDSKRLIEIQKQGDEITIKKLFAHGAIDYLPWNRLTRMHYAVTNTTLNLERVVPVGEIDLEVVDFLNLPVTRDVTYQKPQGRYAPNSAIDLTHGRHVVDQATLVPKLRKLLEEAVNYMEENHLTAEVPNWKHGQTINRIMDTMSLMDIPSLELIFHTYHESKAHRDMAIKNLFYDMVPQVGTPATSLFMLRIIRKRKVDDSIAISMLKDLPQNVKSPTTKLLQQLEDLLRFDATVSVEVRKASILCFSSLAYRAFKDLEHPENNALLQKYLLDFFTRVKDEPNYNMKVVYLMAMRNIEVGRIHRLLEPIITGDVLISENPLHIRLLAIWAVEKSIAKDLDAVNKQLWPIMTNSGLPVKLRIAAYEIMIHIPSETLLSRIDWFMVTETNKHLYNYHYTTVTNIAQSNDPCKKQLREHMEKITRFNGKYENTRYTLSAAYAFDEFDNLGIAEKLDGKIVLNDKTGEADVLQVDYYLASGPESVIDVGIRAHMQGLGEFRNPKIADAFGNLNRIRDLKVLEILEKASRDLPPSTAKFHVDIVLMREGRVVLANHYNSQTLFMIYRDVMPYVTVGPKVNYKMNYQTVKYHQLSQKQVINDMGLPVVMDSRVPIAVSFKYSYDVHALNEETMMMDVDFGLDLKIWRHGEYSLSAYNPIADAWHATRRTTAIDAGLPLRVILSMNPLTYNFNVRFPPLSESKNPIAGLRLFLKDSVTIDGKNGPEALTKSCPTCKTEEDVHDEKAQTTKWVDKQDNDNTGIKWSFAVLDCQLGNRPHVSNLYGAVMPASTEPWGQWNTQDQLVTRRQRMKSMFFYPHIGNCGVLLKAEPSDLYPGSSVLITVRRNGTGDHVENPSYFVLDPMSHMIEASIDLISGSTNSSIASLNSKLEVETNKGHVLNKAKLQLNCRLPGNKIAKVCMSAQKTYPGYPMDPLSHDRMDPETNSVFTFGYNVDDDEPCQTVVTVTMKGDHSPEQVQRADGGYGMRLCVENLENTAYGQLETAVPLTTNCLNDVITYTTLRRYTIDVKPTQIEAYELYGHIGRSEGAINSMLLPYLRLNMTVPNPEILRIVAEFPIRQNVTGSNDDVKTKTWLSTVHLPRADEAENVVEPLWDFPLDNTRFSIHFLEDYTDETIKLCAVYPRVMLTADGKNEVPFEFPSQWTLVTGDHVNKNFAIFAKAVGEKIAAKIYTSRHQLEILPNPDGSIGVTVDGQTVGHKLVAGLSVPSTDDTDDIRLRLTKKDQFIVVDFPKIPSLSVTYNRDHLGVTLHSYLFRGKVSGMCGHMTDAYRTNVTDLHTYVASFQ